MIFFDKDHSFTIRTVSIHIEITHQNCECKTDTPMVPFTAFSSYSLHLDKLQRCFSQSSKFFVIFFAIQRHFWRKSLAFECDLFNVTFILWELLKRWKNHRNSRKVQEIVFSLAFSKRFAVDFVKNLSSLLKLIGPIDRTHRSQWFSCDEEWQQK